MSNNQRPTKTIFILMIASFTQALTDGDNTNLKDAICFLIFRQFFFANLTKVYLHYS